ncbi:secondary thiamine-phosphate synthase enzyme YjbQ [Herbivorax sp. ANBcel31]|uniref:secondary thiamine-phosphate synthase enzyme YjbQ n=1 Tax=Herbivorax sp. ANBcel31 TaxID=3069754 RepID=UPI0027B4E9A3|nr:secondary thiamine-phosphate synthase enzyme YjbQ [Herbivorax sp. ANBcel31]MDQ2084924.1 secondary thiamine-phosphate synthase enzyme YjbQ [Herbivorax sp. ANBcel31]
MDKLNVSTHKQTQMIDITGKIQGFVDKSNIKSGICTIFVPHTTAAVTINENADPDVVHDILMETDKVIPLKDGYLHMEGNSAAHIKASLFGFSEQVIIENGKLVLGTWQGIYFCEFDGARQRQAYVKITG